MIGWRVALAVSAFVVVTTAFAQTQVTDATGRTIALPSKIERVYAAGPPAMVLVLALAPEKLVGWTRAPRDAEAQLRSVAERIAAIPEAQRPRVYFARGSMQAEALTLAGGLNVIVAPAAFHGNLLNVSVEDVLAARPDVIVASDPSFAVAVHDMPAWREVPAVRNGRVYVAPDVPFGWFDAPLSLNRLLGVQWLARLLHPTLFPEPLAPVVKTFHTRYYHRTPSDAQVRELMRGTGLER